MDYYEKFSKEAADRVKALVEQRDELAQVIEQGKKNLESEQGVIQKLKDEREKLKSSSSVELTDDSQGFQNFKDSLSRLDSDIKNAERVCETLRTEIIPQKTTALQTVRVQIKAKLNAFVLESKPINAEQIRIKIAAAAAEKQSFHDAFRRIFKDAGMGFQAFSTDRELHNAYRAFLVMPKRSRPKQPEPVSEQKPENTPELVPVESDKSQDGQTAEAVQ